jgi:hypothetical protein
VLDRVFTDLAALGSLVLRTPLANPLTEGKRRECTTALDTLCHFVVGEHQQFATPEENWGRRKETSSEV